MKRVVEKVKDIVEICPFTHLHDFAADPGLTLAGYHFTDITADLMAKWIDRVVQVRTGHGAAFALAGFRGVGKSHFISVLGAIVSRPELRPRISDQYVLSSAERLSRRHGHVAFVRRGSGTSLLDELKRAVAVILEVNPSTLSDSLYDLMLRASEQSGDLPLVLLIDTALGRGSRVSRDDGVLLGEIADAAKTLGIFVGVALDDDISGADGPNAAISGNFTIDYLDQEHLYKIVDSHIFTKHNQMRQLLHEIYEDYRAELPGFRWSEQRFTSLYPLHPATVDLAPLIRLYIHDFALLGFAAEAGVKILGRPANSLIGIDEFFDNVEARLRLVPDLSDAFDVFDKLEREVNTKTPVQFRHPARLIIKGLLMLSLNGEGASAAEIAAAMMIFGGSDGQSLDIAGLLDSFAETLPKSIVKNTRDGFETKYCFKLAGAADVDGYLAEAVKDVKDEFVWISLLDQTSEKYADFDTANEHERSVMKCTVEWRGSFRRGELIWPSSDEPETSPERRENPDWTVRVQPESDAPPTPAEPEAIVWHVAKLSPEEKDTIRRHYLLHHDATVREQFGDGLSTAMHLHSIAVDKVWQRVFLVDGFLTLGELTFKFTEEARSAHSLSHLFTVMLAPIFENRYPSHPEFGESLGLKQSSSLISNFFSGSGAQNDDAQKLAKAFALPLGLAIKHGDTFVPASAEELAELEIVKSAFGSSDSEGVIPTFEISERLHTTPVGLTREAQHLVLAALVAQRQYEFVTSSGNRINHRSLDLQIIWDDIVGVAKPLNELYAPERLLLWAKLITGNAGIKSVDRTEDRLLIIDSLSGWLAGWKESRTLSDFDALPDENLNAGIWRTAANLRKSFGAMADTIDSLVANDTTLDQCLHLIADLFSDSEAEFEKKKGDLRVLRNFITGVTRRGEIVSYLSLCENTDDNDLERSRLELLETLGSGQFSVTPNQTDRVDEVWGKFKEIYTDYYAHKHDLVMKSTASGEKLREIIRSEEWSTFESFSSILWLDQGYFAKAKTLIREMRQLYCNSNVIDALAKKPFCGCSFSLSETDRLCDLPRQLTATINAGLRSFEASFTGNSEKLIGSADSDAMRASIKTILTGFAGNETFPTMTSQDIRILKIAAEHISDDSTVANATTDNSDEFTQELSLEMSLYKEEVEQVEAFVNADI